MRGRIRGPVSGSAAARAERAHAAMERAFATDGPLLRRDGRWAIPGARAHLWPFVRAMVASIDLAGVPAKLVSEFDATATIARRQAALERYWDPAGPVPGYASDVGRRWWGGDRYHDDNAWVGLALVALERQRPGEGGLRRTAQLWRLAQSGWDRRGDVPSPGGVFWVEQGRGIGRRNHDRNTVSTGPNAQLALHLAELAPGSIDAAGDPSPARMIDWVRDALRDDGLYWDKIRGDGSIDRTVWSYNQGNMIGAYVLMHRAALRDGDAPGARAHLARARITAERSLRHYSSEALDAQPAAFNAIYFRNLLVLDDAAGERSLSAAVRAAMARYAEDAWTRWRDERDIFHLPHADGRVTLLDQSAMVQILALLAWPRERYRLIA